ncbi:DUF1958 domain-containing protein [Enterococcus sp. AZ109]|uniref:DUF1958 domain-containing protein n=1 Tax=Enterococcus sp. AZ109 TaxID=2774634 RepID=UPI003F263695
MVKRVFAVLMFFSLINWTVPAFAQEDILTITRDAGYTDVLEINKPKASIIIEGNNGQILWGDNIDIPREPASISKMMTVFLVFDAIKEGKLTLDTTIKATENDQAISQVYAISNSKIVAGVDYPVRELLKMVTVPSSNVATVMLANAVSNNDAGAFIRSMNEKAQKIGMKQTAFYNCSGASAASFDGLYNPEGYDPYASNLSTARDLATMVFHLVNDHPEVLEFTSQPTVTTMADTPYEETFETYNYSLPGAKYGLDGVDGLKTGSGPSSAFNYIATAKRGETRLIEVILGVGDWADQDGEYYRHPFGNALLERAFNDYEYQRILSKGQHLIDGEDIQLTEDFYGVARKDAQPTLTIQEDQLVLADPLEQVSDTLPRLATTYKSIEKVKPSKEKLNAVQKPLRPKTLRETIVGLNDPINLIVIGATGMIILVLSLLTSRIRRRTTILNIVFRIIGILCLLSAASLFIVNFIL